MDLFKLMDAAEDLIVPMTDHMVRVDREPLTLGYAGGYSAFAPPAERAAARYGIPARDILVSEVVERFAQIGAEPTPMTPERFAAYIQTENERWGKVVRDANIKLE